MRCVYVTKSVLLITFQIVQAISISLDQMKIIVDVVTSYETPTAVTAKVCWKTADKINLASLLNKKDEYKTIKFISKNLNVMGLVPSQSLIILTDMNCPNISTFLDEASKKGLFGKPYRWLIFGESSTEVLKSLTNLSIFPNSEVIILKNSNSNITDLKLIYKLRLMQKWYEEDFGSWTEDGGLIKSERMNICTALRRKNLHKETIVASIVIADDNNTRFNLNDLSPGEIYKDPMAKCGFRHIEPLYEFMNATKELIFADSWGTKLHNGSWTGMIGQIERAEADLSGTGAMLGHDRMTIVEYLINPVNIKVAFIFRKPPLSYQNNLFLLPFRTSVWICIAGFVVLLLIVLYVNAKWEMKKSIPEMDRTSLMPNMSDIGILIVGAITQQGSTTELKGTLGRVVIFLLFTAFLFLYTSYSASIVALLQSSSNQIRTLSDLLQSRLELGVEDTPYSRTIFPIMTEPVRKAIYETKIVQGAKRNFYSPDEGLGMLLKKPFAFHMNLGIGYRLLQKISLEHEKCGLTEIEYFQFNTPWLCCKKHSPYTEIYKIGYFRIHEHGLLDRTNRLIFAKKPQCQTRNSNFISVSMIDMYPALLFLAFGMLVAVLLLLIEILWSRKQLQCKKIRHSNVSYFE